MYYYPFILWCILWFVSLLFLILCFGSFCLCLSHILSLWSVLKGLVGCIRFYKEPAFWFVDSFYCLFASCFNCLSSYFLKLIKRIGINLNFPPIQLFQHFPDFMCAIFMVIQSSGALSGVGVCSCFIYCIAGVQLLSVKTGKEIII